MKKPEDFPLDESKKLNPNNAFFIKTSSGITSDAAVYDLTDVIERKYDGMSSEYIHEADVLAQNAAATHPAFELTKQKFYKRKATVTDESHAEVAGISAPVLSLDLVKFTFPQGSPHSSHDIEMKPVGMGRRAEGFVKDSVQYFWDKHESIAVLTKVIDGKRVEIAKFGAKQVFDKCGVLALDTVHLDELVGIITCVTLLQQLDAFTGPRVYKRTSNTDGLLLTSAIWHRVHNSRGWMGRWWPINGFLAMSGI